MNHQSNNIPEYKVSEFNKIFNETVTTAFSLIKIKGEVSNLKKHYSGHIYFNLKDENSIINAVCWKINKNHLSIQPEEGLEVIAKGKISTYAKSISVYQLNVENIEVAGQGALLKLIEETVPVKLISVNHSTDPEIHDYDENIEDWQYLDPVERFKKEVKLHMSNNLSKKEAINRAINTEPFDRIPDIIIYADEIDE